MFHEILVWVGLFAAYMAAGIIVCATIKCTTDVFDSYDPPPIPVVVFGWPVALVALIVMGMITFGGGSLEKAVNFLAGICTTIKTKLQDRMKED